MNPARLPASTATVTEGARSRGEVAALRQRRRLRVRGGRRGGGGSAAAQRGKQKRRARWAGGCRACSARGSRNATRVPEKKPTGAEAAAKAAMAPSSDRPKLDTEARARVAGELRVRDRGGEQRTRSAKRRRPVDYWKGPHVRRHSHGGGGKGGRGGGAARAQARRSLRGRAHRAIQRASGRAARARRRRRHAAARARAPRARVLRGDPGRAGATFVRVL